MKEAPAGQLPYLVSDPVSSAQDSAFDALERTLRHSGPPGAFEQLIEHLDKAGDYRSLLDALLLKARYDLNLPLIQVGSLSNLAEPVSNAVRGSVRRGDPAGRLEVPGRRRDPRRVGLLPGHRRARARQGRARRVRAGPGHREAGTDHRCRLQPGCQPQARVRVDPGPLRYLLGHHGPRAGSSRRRGNPDRLHRETNPSSPCSARLQHSCRPCPAGRNRAGRGDVGRRTDCGP